MSTRLLESGDTLLIENGTDYRLLEDGDTIVTVGGIQARAGRLKRRYVAGQLTKGY